MITIAQAGLDTAQIRAEIDQQLDLVSDDAFIGSMTSKLERLAERGFSLDIHEDVQTLDSRRQAASEVRQAVTELLRTEYDDGLYHGVPEDRLATVVDDVGLDAAIAWLERTNQIVRAEDGTLRPDESCTQPRHSEGGRSSPRRWKHALPSKRLVGRVEGDEASGRDRESESTARGEFLYPEVAARSSTMLERRSVGKRGHRVRIDGIA
jgi:hypothetical protein